ncbi:class II aldolase/adducin family protein [Salinispora tropica]|uniref:Class II aldolase/adducin family protein n=1 Tax=Salinispora tropica (strain ATCC BAA-916 / DSM 44818 / JCM 13857 / NBRC 105044 / CNB-440) TaxID=369723 RepID=A4X8M9_SALTO|nr:class II aldolase/adducin family protein [Salinispora tropica]ABP55229.1 class II aldolase/adducin family protein [Salinispora tropica CNB-440]
MTGRTPAEERLRRQRQLAATCRLFARLGFDEGAGGHVTARDPEHPDRFWINPFGMHFGHVRVSDLLLVDPAGAVLEGEGRINPAGYVIHSHVHAARADTVAAAHTHSTYGRAWCTLGRPLSPITQDACAFYEDHAVFDDYTGVVLADDEGKRIAEALGPAKAVILRNHGLLTVGGSVAEAAWWFITMDRSCQVQLLAEAAGSPVPIDHGAAAATRDTIGTPEIARLNFRPLYADIVHEQPDLLN